MPPSPIGKLVDPQSIAVVGASDDLGKISGKILHTLTKFSFPGRVYAVNPHRSAVQGRRSYASVRDLPEPVDLAIIYVSKDQVPDVVESCADSEVGVVMVLSAGYAETGSAGAADQVALMDQARAGGLRLAGPNCAGVASLPGRFAAYGTTSFMQLSDLRSGGISLISQSGGMGNTIFSLLQERGLGMSLMVSTGNEADLGLGEYLEFLASHEGTQQILVFAEAFRDLSRVIAAVRRCVEVGKPVLILRTGRTAAGQRAAASHTGALAREARVTDSGLRQAGAILVDDLDDLVDHALLLRRYDGFSGRGVGIYTLPGGAAALTSDLAIENGLTVPTFDESTVVKLRALLPALASCANPVDPTADILGDPAGFPTSLRAVTEDPNVDVCVVLPVVGQEAIGRRLAAEVIQVADDSPVPVVVLWPGDRTTGAALHDLDRAEVPVFTSASRCFRAIRGLYDLGRARRRITSSETAACLQVSSIELAAARAVLETMPIGVGPEIESMRLLAAYGIATTSGIRVMDVEQSVAAASRVGYPVVVKGEAPGFAHKSEHGLVRTGVGSEVELRAAVDEIAGRLDELGLPSVLVVAEMIAESVELIVGCKAGGGSEPSVTVLGAGGLTAELVDDVAVRTGRLTTADVVEMMEEFRGHVLLDGWHGRPAADRSQVADVVVRLNALVSDLSDQIDEVEINPLMVRAGSVVAADAVVVRRGGSDRA